MAYMVSGPISLEAVLGSDEGVDKRLDLASALDMLVGESVSGGIEVARSDTSKVPTLMFSAVVLCSLSSGVAEVEAKSAAWP